MLHQVATHTIDSLSEGQSFAFMQLVSGADIDAFAALSGDVSPLHVDAAFARSRGFSDRVVHGALISAYVSRLFGVHLPGRDCFLQSLNMRFLSPSHAGDVLELRAEISQLNVPLRTFTADVRVTCNGNVVAKGKAQIGLIGENK